MKMPARLLLAAGVMTLLSGCSYIDRFTGETNNTVLPGTREDAIPGRPSFPEKPDPNVGTVSSGSAASSTASSGAAMPGAAPEAIPGADCAANDPACKPPASTSDTFKDPQ